MQVAELAAALATATSSGAALVAEYVDNDGLVSLGELAAEAAAFDKAAANATCPLTAGDRTSNRMPQPLNGRTLWASPDPAAPAAPAAGVAAAAAPAAGVAAAAAASAGARGARAAAAVAAVAAAAFGA